MPSQTDVTDIPPGMLAVTTYGTITPETCQSLVELRGFNDVNGLTNVHYQMVHGNLVDKARNEAVSVMFQNPALKYILFIDADMQFPPDIMYKLLMTAYHPNGCHWADLVGAYCQLRGKPYLPTIDTGTGTWEEHDAGCGPLEVMRTGSACILIKRPVYERMEYPWYGVRPAPRAIDMMAELDNYARVKMDGRNLLRDHPAWAILEKCAWEDAAAQRSRPESALPNGLISSVGEDSNFCDKAKALGFRVVVQTDAITHHVDRILITPEMHQEAMKESALMTRYASGILE